MILAEQFHSLFHVACVCSALLIYVHWPIYSGETVKFFFLTETVGVMSETPSSSTCLTQFIISVRLFSARLNVHTTVHRNHCLVTVLGIK